MGLKVDRGGYSKMAQTENKFHEQIIIAPVERPRELERDRENGNLSNWLHVSP